MELLLALPCLAALPALSFARSRRALLERQRRVVAAYRDVDALYRLRHDLVPSLTTALGAHLSPDRGAAVERLVAVRASILEDRFSRDPFALETRLEAALSDAFGVADTHSVLSHDAQFQHLRRAFADVGAEILEARLAYNARVEALNRAISSPVGGFVARGLGLEPRHPFFIAPAAPPGTLAAFD